MILSGGTTTLGVYDFKAGLDKEASSVNSANGETQQQINDYIGTTWYSKVGGYGINDKVRLATGEVVFSTIPSNTNDPNSNRTGWLNIGNISVVESIAEMLAIANPKTGNSVTTKSYIAGLNKGGTKYIYDATRAAENNGVTCING
jgi:hypothetical protein